MKKIVLLLCIIVGLLNGQTLGDLHFVMANNTDQNKGRPLLIVMHGYGSNENDLLSLAKQVAPKCLIISLQAPNAVSQDGFCWYHIERLANKQIKYDYEEVKSARSKVLAAIRVACKQYKCDSNQVFLMGFSQGAMMSYDLLLQSNFKFKGIAALSGRLVEESSKQPQPIAKTKVFVAHGTNDNLIDYSESQKIVSYLSPLIKSALVYKSYPEAHTINMEEMTDLKFWFESTLK